MQITLSKAALLAVCCALAACGSNPQSYIKAKKEPIVNIEAALNAQLQVEADTDRLIVENKLAEPVQLSYKFFWYDQNGVSQNAEDNTSSNWRGLRLNAKQRQQIAAVKPTEESVNYRIYLKR